MRAALVLILSCALPAYVTAAEDRLAPAELLAALQRVQDSIAIGDKSALPLQAQMIRMLDESYAQDARNPQSEAPDPRTLLIFALSGGSRAAAASMIGRLPKDSADHALAEAVLAYINGDIQKARRSFEPQDPLKLGARLAPYAAFAKAMSNLPDNPDAARGNFDLARLLAPGTLIEEAALRRLLSLHAKVGDADAFAGIARQYGRRYAASPYAREFAELFVSGCVALDPKLTPAAISAAMDGVPAAHRSALYLRLARQAAIAGHLQLAAFASDALAKDGGPVRSGPRLYALISELATGDTRDVSKKLRGMDASALPQEDRPLLYAAQSLADSIIEPTKAAAAPQRRAKDEKPQTGAGSEKPSEPAVEKAGRVITSAQEKLNAVDKLLGGAQQ